MTHAMQHLLLALFSYIGLLLQVGLTTRVAVAPDLLALAGIAALLTFHDWRGVVWMGLIGLLSDCVGAGRPGPGMAAASVAGLAVHGMWTSRRPRSVWSLAVWTFGIVSVTRMAADALRIVEARAPFSAAASVLDMAVGAAATAALAVVLAPLLRMTRDGGSSRSGNGMQSAMSYRWMPE